MTSVPLPLAAFPYAGTLAVLVGGLLVMTALWVVHLRTRNAAWVDVGWSALLGLAALGLAVAGSGPPGRRILLAAMVGLWSARLTLHLVRERIADGEEEGRYRRLRDLWGERADLYFLPFFWGQAVLVALLATPFLLAAHDARPFPSVLDATAALLWLLAFGLEAVADRQLARFRADPANAGRTCRDGLWAWSRHPNYFFEWLQWCAFALLATGSAYAWLAWLAPALLLLFILKITGIPPTEAQALRSRGDDYRRYQATTSPFVPWPPKREASS